MSPEDVPDDAVLVMAAQAGDSRAFEQLVNLHIRAVRVFVALRAPVAQLVDEISHETFVHAYHHLKDFEPGTSLRAWLRAIAFQKLRAETQRFAREQANQLRFAEQLALDEEFAEPQRDRSGPEADALAECLGRVTGEHRELLNLKYRDDRDSDSIAKRLRKSAAWVRTTLFRVREALRACIEGKTAQGTA